MSNKKKKQEELDIGSNPHRTKAFEIVVQLRGHTGECTGKTKSFAHDNPSKVSDFWHRTKGKPKRRVSRKNLPKAQEADKLVGTMAQYAEEVRNKKQQK